MELRFIRYQITERIAFVTLNRPEKRNALNADMVEELKQACTNAAGDEQVKVIVLKAEGKAFCAGADLEYLMERQENSPMENLTDSQRLKDLFLKISTCPKAVIAQVQGAAVAGGCGLITVCDLVFSVPEAVFGYTENKIGFVPALVAPFLLQRAGGARTRELLLSGNLIPAETAREYGLVNFLSPMGSLEEEVRSYALKLARSEEHTSELQSLMRSSYAVFCLKKKQAASTR